MYQSSFSVGIGVRNRVKKAARVNALALLALAAFFACFSVCEQTEKKSDTYIF